VCATFDGVVACCLQCGGYFVVCAEHCLGEMPGSPVVVLERIGDSPMHRTPLNRFGARVDRRANQWMPELHPAVLDLHQRRLLGFIQYCEVYAQLGTCPGDDAQLTVFHRCNE
jgi:hypothetical protein